MNSERRARLPLTLNRSVPTTFRRPKPSPQRLLYFDDNSALGPGSYEVKSTFKLHEGFSFPVNAKEDDKDVSCTQPLSGFRYSFLDNPGPGYYVRAEVGEAKGYSFPAATQKRLPGAELLGPGSYYILNKHQTSGHYFSPSPRFDLSPIDKLTSYTPRLHTLTKEHRHRIKQRIRENKDLSPFSPERRAQLLQESAEMRAERLNITRSMKLLKDEERHFARLTRFEEKLTRLSLKLNSSVPVT